MLLVGGSVDRWLLQEDIGGNVVQALQLSLRDPPYQTRTDSVKNMSFDVVLKVLNTVKDAEIANVVGALTMEECDVLMKYIYRGLGPAGKKNETAGVLMFPKSSHETNKEYEERLAVAESSRASVLPKGAAENAQTFGDRLRAQPKCGVPIMPRSTPST